MTTLSIEDLLFAARRRGRRLPPFASSQLLCAAIRAAESQGVSVEPAIFLLDAQDGLVLDLSGASEGKASVQSAAELGRTLLLSPKGELQGPGAAAVLRALERGGFATLGAFRQAIEVALPAVPAAQLRKVVAAFRDLAEAWNAGNDGEAIFDALETLCGAGAASPPPRAAPAPHPRPASAASAPQPQAAPAPLSSPPRPAPTPAPQQPRASPPPFRPPHASSAAPVVAPAPIALTPAEQPSAVSTRPAASSRDEAPLENRLAAIEGVLGRLETRPSRSGFLGSMAIAVFSALAGAAAAVGALHATAQPPPPAPAPPPAAEPVRACPPLLIIHEPAPAPASPPAETQAAATPQPASAPSAAADEPAPPHASRKRRSARSDGASSRARASAEVSKGDRALRTGQLDEALAAFQAALAKDARSAPAVRGLAMVHMTQGREADARREYLQYLDLAPQAPDASRIRKVVENLGVQQ